MQVSRKTIRSKSIRTRIEKRETIEYKNRRAKSKEIIIKKGSCGRGGNLKRSIKRKARRGGGDWKKTKDRNICITEITIINRNNNNKKEGKKAAVPATKGNQKENRYVIMQSSSCWSFIRCRIHTHCTHTHTIKAGFVVGGRIIDSQTTGQHGRFRMGLRLRLGMGFGFARMEWRCTSGRPPATTSSAAASAFLRPATSTFAAVPSTSAGALLHGWPSAGTRDLPSFPGNLTIIIIIFF